MLKDDNRPIWEMLATLILNFKASNYDLKFKINFS